MSEGGIAIDDAQSLARLDPVSFSQSSSMQRTHGSILSQGLQYDGQNRAIPHLLEGGRNMNSNMSAAATPDQGSASGSKAAAGDIYANCFRDPDYELINGTGEEYAYYFPEPGNVCSMGTGEFYAQCFPELD